MPDWTKRFNLIRFAPGPLAVWGSPRGPCRGPSFTFVCGRLKLVCPTCNGEELSGRCRFFLCAGEPFSFMLFVVVGVCFFISLFVGSHTGKRAVKAVYLKWRGTYTQRKKKVSNWESSSILLRGSNCMFCLLLGLKVVKMLLHTETPATFAHVYVPWDMDASSNS